jgi:hypothetical protein
MSENTINAALRRMRFTKEEMTGHGFRAVASTLLNESGKWNAERDLKPTNVNYGRGNHSGRIAVLPTNYQMPVGDMHGRNQ